MGRVGLQSGVPALDLSRPTLVLDASTPRGSVALLYSETVLTRAVRLGAGTDDVLFPAITALLSDASLRVSDLAAIVCGDGPGSFTSLRIAGALAKGMAHGTGVALYAVPSLLLAAASLPHDAPAGAYLVHADALRGERYTLRVERAGDGAVHADRDVVRMMTPDVDLHDAVWRVRVDAGASSAATPDALSRAAQSAGARDDQWVVTPDASSIVRVHGAWRTAPVDLAQWEPQYGRKAEAQVKWETTHGTPLPRG